MGKHRLSIAKKSLLAAKPHRVKPKRIKQPSQPVRSQGGDRAEDPSTTAAQRHHKQRETRVAPQVQEQPFWVPHAPVVRHSSEAVSKLLSASETKRSGASIKSLCLAAHVTAKKATFALTVQTLRYLPVLQKVVSAAHLLERHPKLTQAVAYVLCYEVLFGQSFKPTGPAERCMYNAKANLREQLESLVKKSRAQTVEDLLPATLKQEAVPRARTVRVNTLLWSVEEALAWLESPPQQHAKFTSQGKGATRDEMMPDVLVLPGGTHMHDHPLVLDHKLILQSRSSCMAAHALAPSPGDHVVDCCAAPGNKTTHLAALLGRGGRVDAFEKDGKRAAHLQTNLEACGAGAVTVHQGDFLQADVEAPELAGATAVLLDPSCSGSGTVHNRMDWLLPSAWQGDAANDGALAANTLAKEERVEKLADFQEAALRHALHFPASRRLVYSTCSVHQRENEAVIAAVLPEAKELGFRLRDPFPAWHRRGLPGSVEGADKLVRVDPEADDTDGFFIAVLERQGSAPTAANPGRRKVAKTAARASIDTARRHKAAAAGRDTAAATPQGDAGPSGHSQGACAGNTLAHKSRDVTGPVGHVTAATRVSVKRMSAGKRRPIIAP